jgi:hypothetical protein
MAQAACDHIANHMRFPTARPRARAAAKPLSDARLLQLGRKAAQLEAWFDAQDNCVPPRPDTDSDPEYVRRMDEHGDLLEAIIATPALTDEGRRVKPIASCTGARASTPR